MAFVGHDHVERVDRQVLDLVRLGVEVVPVLRPDGPATEGWIASRWIVQMKTNRSASGGLVRYSAGNRFGSKDSSSPKSLLPEPLAVDLVDVGEPLVRFRLERGECPGGLGGER